MSQRSFEFLASEPQWEQACLRNPREMDKLPETIRDMAKHSWTCRALLLAILTAIDKDKKENASIDREKLASRAKNGEPKTSEGGFPGLMGELKGQALPASDFNKEATIWRQFSSPEPALLDAIPEGSLLVRADVELASPFYSRDDQPFYPTENALRRDKVFDVPFLSAAGLKGLLRWASRTARQTTEDDADDLFLFGDIKDASQADGNAPSGSQGSVRCYPVHWSGAVGLEVINPQRTDTGAGSTPIKYEVLKAGGTARLHFLLASLPSRRLAVRHVKAFLQSLGYLLNFGGLSAKSSAGWGKVRLTGANAAMRGMATRFSAEEKKTNALVQESIDKAAEEAWAAFTGPDGALIPLAGNEAVFTNKRIRAVLPDCSNKMAKDKEACYAQISEKFEALNATSPPGQEEPETDAPTAWLWPEAGEPDFSTFSERLLGVFEKKEARA